MLRQTVLISINEEAFPNTRISTKEDNPPDSVVQSAIARVE